MSLNSSPSDDEHSDAARTLRRVALGVAGTLAVAFLATFARRSHADHALRRIAQQTAPPTVEVVTVAPAHDHQLSLPGETAAWYESTIYARVSGYVATWSADIGDHVAAGQLLALLDTPELDAELAAAHAKLQEAQAQVKLRAAEADFAQSSYVRWRDSPKGVVSDQEREDKKAGAASALAQLEAAQGEVSLDIAEVKRLSALQRFKRVVAPYSGTITQRRIDIGDLVTAGSSTNTTPLYRLVQDDPMRVFVDVPQSAATELMKVGVPARISLPDASDQIIDATIARTSSAIDLKARTFRAELDVANPAAHLVPGEYVHVTFTLASRGLSEVPAAALIFRSGGPEVARIGHDGAVRFCSVTIGRDDGDTIEIASGVVPGDQLALNISGSIEDGEQVRTIGSASVAPLARATQSR